MQHRRWQHTLLFRQKIWPASATPIHLTEIDLDDTSSPNDLFGEANVVASTQTQTHAELPPNSIHKESEEKSEPNGNHWTDDPDHLLPSNLTNFELKP